MRRGDEELSDTEQLALADNGGDLKVSGIPHRCVAQLCVHCLDFPNAARATFCAMTVPTGEGEDSYLPLLAKVSPDRRSFAGGELFRKHQLAVRVGGLGLAGFAAGILSSIVVTGRVLMSALPALR
mmetsp:Transcript_104266/g.222900  ORF Transcript_104266/g.222900 Transcript_104266/m.222900 type:complete len:126 (+) Transcript_104266:1-378(+)